jgi:hypothetical protein
VIVEPLLTVTAVAATPPTITLGVAPKLLPLIVTGVPPNVDPCAGYTATTWTTGAVGAVGEEPHALRDNDSASVYTA